MYGVYANPVPYGSTTVNEYIFEDWFIEEAMEHYGMTEAEWDALPDDVRSDKLNELSMARSEDRE